MTSLDETLTAHLDRLREQDLFRRLRRVDGPQATRIVIDGRECLNFSSNDYLGLANHPALKEAAGDAIGRFGAGSGASRLISGSLAPLHELEESLAAFKGTERALVFSSGHAAALGSIPALVGRGDVVVIDRLAHACIVDAARLSGARLRVFAHNDVDALARVLRRLAPAESAETTDRSVRRAVLIVTESLFSMDGDLAPLREIVNLKSQHGAWLMVDEAHATGLYGRCRRGLIEELGLTGQVDVQMGTLGKALGTSGGFIAGSRPLIEYLLNRARSFVFSTAPTPATAAAALAALRIVQSSPGVELAAALWGRVEEVSREVARLGWKTPGRPSPIFPLHLGAEGRALHAAEQLFARGIYVPAIRYPSVARGEARLRLTVSAVHTREEIRSLVSGLETCQPPATHDA